MGSYFKYTETLPFLHAEQVMIRRDLHLPDARVSCYITEQC